MNNLIGIILATIYIVFVILTAKLVEKKGKEASRKWIHIMLCNIWFIYLAFIDNIIAASILPAIFVVINTLSYKFNIIKLMERENKKDGFGTIYYALSILVLSIATYYVKNPVLATTGLFIMGYGDGLAAIVGKSVKSKKFTVLGGEKSIAGSATMFIVSLIVSIISLFVLGTEMIIIKSVIIAIISTALEAVSIKGLDNITVPLLITLLVANII